MLYDVRPDIGEKADVAAQHRDIVKKIGAYLQIARTGLPEWEPQWQNP